MSSSELRVSILPAGAWGTAFAKIVADNDHQIKLYFNNSTSFEEFRKFHQSNRLKGVTLPQNVEGTSNFQDAVKDSDVVVLAPPSAYFRELFKKVKPFLSKEVIVLSLTKGFEVGTNLRMSQILADEDPDIVPRTAILSGPNFAKEIGEGKPAGTVVASEKSDIAKFIQIQFSTARFRIYRSNELVGVELGGALKNVFAIAMGVSDGRGYGENARSFMMVRGLAEMTRLGVALGAKAETFLGLSGVGDLDLTGNSPISRNYQAGFSLGIGKSLEEIKRSGKTMEGIPAAKSAIELAKKYHVDMPISEAVYNVFFNGVTIDQAIANLQKRELTSENGD